MTRKQPDALRQRLIDMAIRIGVEDGLGALTVQAVAGAAGVSKGGLFHHFPSKQALVEGVVAHLLDRIDAEIDALIAADPQPWGRFTRAYVITMLNSESFGCGTPWSALSVALMTEPALAAQWAGWLSARLARHADTDAATPLAIARLAADGAWLSHATGASHGLDPAEVADRLAPLMTAPG
ncbi:TetR/AcrR family transcriptional regulator [Ruixingdingia sedimenti]|uniref:TetR/AcrR family transcriptional regulator n=1 Tax=Ruixingdingia sedimenti TaxID=3073604 RepID=A0ABU1F9K9_9RHOB|nr:TetR/AcrR family transcriptional regulator [Xinfangfangia sp. LG-4]MDR5653569.1 TetR/AcrR family transcriptional regulator [Xinfangfangia sp. LG-4]